MTIFVIGCLTLCVSGHAQKQSRQLKGGGHVLGETAEQFYSEGSVGDVFRACQAKDWKSVKQLLKNEDHLSHVNAKDFCAALAADKQQAMNGARHEYKGSGDAETRRADTFTLDAGHLVKIEMIYNSSTAHFEGFHPKSFADLYEGLKEAYGEPTKAHTEPFVDTYGVKYEAHRAEWMSKKDIILILEQPGANGWTEIVAETIAEYDRAARTPKTTNPLQ